MVKAKDLTGQKFGSLTVIKKAYVQNHKIYWLCKCDCGNKKVVRADKLKSYNTKSCGCMNQRQRHGLSHCKIYTVWQGIKKRCYSTTDKYYMRYGGRGIIMCSEWKNNFLTFYDWAMVNGYKDNLSIDRIDNNGNYEPSNCRWVTMKEQNRNKSNCHFLTYKNETHCVTEWAEILGLSIKKIYMCFKKGEDIFRINSSERI